MVTTMDAREYLRVSYDRSGRERSNDEQHDENRAAWDGWTWGEHYSDATSASRYARKERDDWPRLIGDLRAGRFGARRLVLWESSRGSRRVGEWVELLDLLEQRSVLVAVTEHHRVYDPTNPRDRRSLLEDAVDSEYESAKTAGRVKRATVAAAKAGRPMGGRVPYGYRRVHDERTGAYTGQVVEPGEAAVVRELYDRLAAGHSLRGIATDFAARGVEKRSGGPFSHQHLRNTATNPLYMGKRVYIPGRRGGTTSSRELNHPDAIVTDAEWPAIVPERTWLAVQAILTDPGRVTWRPGRAVHLLTGTVRCDVCSGAVAANYARGTRRYLCHTNGCVKINADDLDEFAEKVMLAYLARPGNAERLTAEVGDDEQLEAARLQVAQIKADLDDLADQVGRRQLSPTLAARAEPQLLTDLAGAEARAAELSTPSKLRWLLDPGTDIAARWDAAPMSAKRDAARMLLAPDVIGELRVTPSPVRGQRVPAAQRVTWRTA